MITFFETYISILPFPKPFAILCLVNIYDIYLLLTKSKKSGSPEVNDPLRVCACVCMCVSSVPVVAIQYASWAVDPW